jgi:thiol-disulfide isomerase/thioredoxin
MLRGITAHAAVALTALVGWIPPASAGAVRVGDPLPLLALPDLRGTPVPLTATRGRVVVVDFWASWCQACREALPALDAISRRHAAAGLTVIAINIDKTAAAGERFLQDHLPVPAMTMLHDPGGGTLARFGAPGMPSLYIADRNGVVRLVEAGYQPGALTTVEQRIVEMLSRGDNE